MKLKTLGERLIVEDIIDEDDITARGQKAGLQVVVFDENKPRPTKGKVVGLGSGPMVNEEIKVGDIVFFSKHAGTETIVEGKSYRTLEYHEITNVLTPEEAPPLDLPAKEA